MDCSLTDTRLTQFKVMQFQTNFFKTLTICNTNFETRFFRGGGGSLMRD